jgi:hypothetical protein
MDLLSPKEGKSIREDPFIFEIIHNRSTRFPEILESGKICLHNVNMAYFAQACGAFLTPKCGKKWHKISLFQYLFIDNSILWCYTIVTI